MHGALETPRLRLRPMVRKDAALFCGLYSDPETMRFIARPMSRVQALADFRTTLRAMRSDRYPAFFTIVTTRRKVAIGVCAIQAPEPRARRVEVGLMLTRDARRRGFGTECVKALISVAFEALPIDTVWVQYRAANAAAERLFAGLGFLPMPRFRPRSARRKHSIAVMRRFAFERQQPTCRGKHDVEHDQLS